MTMTLRDETINQSECDKDRNDNFCFKNKNYEISKMGDITLSYGLVKYMTIAEKTLDLLMLNSSAVNLRNDNSIQLLIK